MTVGTRRMAVPVGYELVGAFQYLTYINIHKHKNHKLIVTISDM